MAWSWSEIPAMIEAVMTSERVADWSKLLPPEDLGRENSKRPTIPFVQCAAGNGPAFPGVGDWIFTFVLAQMRASGCSVLLS
jgi:hypothetical protein